MPNPTGKESHHRQAVNQGLEQEMRITIIILTVALLTGCNRKQITVDGESNHGAAPAANQPTNHIEKVKAELAQQEILIQDLEDKIIELKRDLSTPSISNLVVDLEKAEARYKEIYLKLHSLVVENELKIAEPRKE